MYAVQQLDSLHPLTRIGTERCALIPVRLPDRDIIFVDTPGFDDTTRSDSEILESISETLVGQYELGYLLRGIIFVHQISERRLKGSDVKNLELFQKICGDLALKNVVLVTSGWDEIDEDRGMERERQYREDIWSSMIRKGSKMMRFYGTEDSAGVIASYLLEQSNVMLQLQKEVLVEHKRLDETSAGSFAKSSLERSNKKPEDIIAEQTKLEIDIEARVAKRLEKLKATDKHPSKWKKSGKIALAIMPTAIAALGMLAGIPTGFGGLDDLLTGN